MLSFMLLFMLRRVLRVTHVCSFGGPRFDWSILTYKGLFREITLRFNKDQKSGTYSDNKDTKGTIILIEK